MSDGGALPAEVGAYYADGHCQDLSWPQLKTQAWILAIQPRSIYLYGCGSRLKSQGYAVCSLWFHVPRCHFDTFVRAAAVWVTKGFQPPFKNQGTWPTCYSGNWDPQGNVNIYICIHCIFEVSSVSSRRKATRVSVLVILFGVGFKGTKGEHAPFSELFLETKSCYPSADKHGRAQFRP